MRHSVNFVLCLVLLPTAVLGNYQCACNYHVSHNVYDTPSTLTMPAGYLYKAECKALVKGDDLDKDWVAIAMFHKVGYMKLDFNVQIETCQGDPDPSDKLTTTTTVRPSSTSTPALFPWTQTPTGQHGTGQTLPSGGAQINPSSTASSALFPWTNTPSPSRTSTIVSGDISLCPEPIQLLGKTGNGALSQYGNHCLQLVLTDVIWEEAEWRCRSNGGHLVEIRDQAENNFMKQFISMHTFFPVWIGLHDTVTEEEFRWTSDPNRPVTYLNWNPNYHTDQHWEEDCAVFGPDGQWDDRRCGHYASVDNLAIKYGYMCQYDVKSPGVIPVG